MSSAQTVKSRSFVRSRDVHRAACISIAIHLLVLAVWLLGNTFDVWRHVSKPRVVRIEEIVFELPQPLLNPAVKKETGETREPDPVLTFVEVDPSQIVEEMPADAKFYGAASTLAANPRTGEDRDTPKLEGTQTEFLKTLEDRKNNLNPPSPRENGVDQTQGKPVQPKAEIVKSTDAKLEDRGKSPAKELVEQKAPLLDQPTAKITSEPQPEPPKSQSDEAVEVVSANPKPENTERPPANKLVDEKPISNDLLKRDKLSDGVVELPKRESERVVQLASGNSNPQTPELPELPSAEQLNQKSESDQIVELASMRPMLPKENKRQNAEADVLEPLQKKSPFEAGSESQPPDFKNSTDIAYVRKQDYEEVTDVQNDPLGTAAPSRPRTLADVPRGSQGEQSALEGGVQRYDLNTSLMVKGTVIGDYEQRIIIAVRQQWDTLLESTTSVRPGKVVLDFRIHMDGRISELKVRESTVGEIQTLCCEKAILDPAPYSRWPTTMRNELKTDSRDVTFTFYYLAQ